MNGANVIIPSKFSHAELCEAFNVLFEKHRKTVWKAIYDFRKISINEDKDDYFQEASIYVWKHFQRKYTGAIAPMMANGDPGDWPGWFYYYSLFGAKSYHKRLHLKKQFYSKSFGSLPESYEPADLDMNYDWEKEDNLSKIENVVETFGPGKKVSVYTYIDNRSKLSEAFAEHSLSYRRSTLKDVKWILAVLKHKIKDANLIPSIRSQNILFGDAIDYVAKLRSECMHNQIMKNDFLTSCESIKYLATLVNIDAKKVSQITSEDCMLIAEKSQALFCKNANNVLARPVWRLSHLFDLFKDIGFVEKNQVFFKKLPQLTVYKKESLKRGSGLRKVRNGGLRQINKSGVIIKIWDSAFDASRAGYTLISIRRCIRDPNKFVNGYRWEYVSPKSSISWVPIAETKKKSHVNV